MELLRDVLRTDDAAGRTRRRWLLFPISVAVHVVAAVAYLIIPLAAEVTLPTPAAPFASRHWVMPVAAPPPALPPVTQRASVPSSSAAPTEAPATIVPEVPAVPALPAPDGAIEGSPGLGVDVPDGLSDAAAATGAIVPPPPPPPRPREVVHVGGVIRAPLKTAGAAPVYPAIAMAARVDGQVVLEALIDEHGKVDRVRVISSVPLLDAAAMDAVRSWRYTPTLLNGMPVSVLMTVTVRFTLQR